MINYTDLFKWNSKYTQNKINNFNTIKKQLKLKAKILKEKL